MLSLNKINIPSCTKTKGIRSFVFNFSEIPQQLSECFGALQQLTVLVVISLLSYKVRHVFHLKEALLYKYLFDVEVLKMRE